MPRNFDFRVQSTRAKSTRFLIPAFLGLLWGCASHKPATPLTSITLNGHGAGRIFDGIGALSAGASSRLLIDYPEPYRGQILDYLFKPDYGAALQHLKVEIGADVNSTDGSEPGFARTRAEMAHPDFNRGYEWWLMEEAKKRNPHIILDALPWGAPGWIGHFFSRDMADYVAKFIQGAKSAHRLDLKYVGIWNETPYEAGYVMRLKKALLKNRLSTGIVCCDLTPGEHQWTKVTDDVRKYPEFKNAVSVIGVHYPDVIKGAKVPEAAVKSGKALWVSEAEFRNKKSNPPSEWSPAAESLAMIYNLDYIRERATTTEIWSPVTSYYDILAAPRSGLMTANTPWSGHYKVRPTIWATAHTTQFAQPGWQYINSACGYLRGQGTFVSLKSPSGRDYSVILETVKAKGPQLAKFRITGGLSQGTVHIWETNATRTFDHVSDIQPHGGSFTVTLDPNSIYSLTTTTGQHKGTATPPSALPFPFPYTENFQNTKIGESPRYFADQDGAFEVHPCARRPGRCLEQTITRIPIPWGPLPDPYTLLGNAGWKDYTVSVDAMLEGSGDVTLLGRIDDANVFENHKARFPSAYILLVRQNGHWELLSTRYNKTNVKLASGRVRFAMRKWHHLELHFHGADIEAYIDGAAVAKVVDKTHTHGMAGIGSNWNRAQFDNFEVR